MLFALREPGESSSQGHDMTPSQCLSTGGRFRFRVWSSKVLGPGSRVQKARVERLGRKGFVLQA